MLSVDVKFLLEIAKQDTIMEFEPVFEYFKKDIELFIAKFKITRATFYNWKRDNRISLNGQLKAEIITDGRFKASQDALARG